MFHENVALMIIFKKTKFFKLRKKQKIPMALSIQKRWEIIFLNKHPYGPKMNQNRIAKYLGIDKSTVKVWIQRYEDTGDVQNLEGRGRKRKTSAEEDNGIIELFQDDEEMTLTRAKEKLKKRRIEVSTNTIFRRLKERGFTLRVPLSKPLLTFDHRKKRVEWCNQVTDINWDQVIFSDESTFILKSYKRKYWTTGIHRKVLRFVKHPQKIHVWGCFCSSGFGRLYIFKENLDSNKLINIYKKALLPSIKKFGFQHNNDCWFQEDNDPKHTSKAAKKWKSENNIKKLPWPSNSPDLSPIENLWGIMKIKVAEKKLVLLRV